MDDEEISFCFDEGGEFHKVPWTELLSVGTELPFESFDEVHIGMKVMAPWLDDDGCVKYAESTVVSPTAGNGKAFPLLLYYMNLMSNYVQL